MKPEHVPQPEARTNSRLSAIAEAAEKRNHPRVPVSVGVEIVDIKTRACVTGRATDFGVGGCYVDTMTTFAKGTAVEVFLHWQGRQLHLQALVSYAVNDRSIGMGLSFTGSSAEQGATLLDWVTGLSSEPPTKPAPKTAAGNTEKPIGGPRLDAIIGELIALLVRKQVLTESEGAQLDGQIFAQRAPGGSGR